MLRVGDRFGRYEIRAPLGQGGMGEVLLAFDAVLQRLVALKIVRRDVARPGAVARLLAEARAAAALKHPGIVTLLDAGEIDGTPFLAMEYVEGDTLRAHVGLSRDVAPKLVWLKELAEALGAAHAAGILHRDVKPDNVIVTKDGHVKVLDFGIAKRTGPESGGPDSVHTAEGRVVGTTAYMAPEQLAGGQPSPKWDQFAWAMTAYEVLSGMRPTAKDVALLSTFAPGVSFEVATTVARAMSPTPERRFEGMAEIARALGSAAGHPTTSGTPPMVAEAAPAGDRRPPATTAPLQVTRTRAPGERRSSAWRAIVALLAFTVGASVVGFFARRRAVAVAAPHASESSGTTATTASVVGTTNGPPPEPSHEAVAASAGSGSARAAARSSAPRAASVVRLPESGLGCLCMPLTPPTESLCPKQALTPAQCDCTSDDRGKLCGVPWRKGASDDVCASAIFGGSITSRAGDACRGYADDSSSDGGLRNTPSAGTLANCRPCVAPGGYHGKEKSSCIGYRDDRTPATGVVDCSNLRIGCRLGDAPSCEALRARAKARL